MLDFISGLVRELQPLEACTTTLAAALPDDSQQAPTTLLLDYLIFKIQLSSLAYFVASVKGGGLQSQEKMWEWPVASIERQTLSPKVDNLGIPGNLAVASVRFRFHV